VAATDCHRKTDTYGVSLTSLKEVGVVATVPNSTHKVKTVSYLPQRGRGGGYPRCQPRSTRSRSLTSLKEVGVVATQDVAQEQASLLPPSKR
jgi:hypothetical protein